MPYGLPLALEFLEEFLPDITKGIWRWFRGGGKKEESTTESGAATVNRLQDKMNETFEGVAAYWAQVAPDKRQNLDDSLRLMSEDEQDAAERALGRMLGQLKNGIFPATVKRVTGKSPHKIKGRDGKESTVFHDKTIETVVEKEGWDPGKIFVDALNNAGESRESASRFWKMMLQASPFMRMVKKLTEWVSGKKFASKVLLLLTLTRRKKVRRKSNLKKRVTPIFRNETDKEMIARAWKRLFRFIFFVVVLVVLSALIAIPILFFKLTFGSVASAAGVSGALGEILWIAFVLGVLSAVAVLFLRLWGFEFAWRRYWATLFFLTTVGLGVRLIAFFFNAGQHPLLAPIAVLAIAILAWNGVYRRLVQWEPAESASNLQRTLNYTAMVLLSGAVIGMLPSHAGGFTAWALERGLDTRKLVAHLSPSVTVSPLTGEVKWCRPFTERWPEALPHDVPRKFRCDVAVDGYDPVTRLPAVPLDSESTIELLEWEARQEREVKEKVAAPSSISTPSGQYLMFKTITIQPGEKSEIVRYIPGKVLETSSTACVEVEAVGRRGKRNFVDCPNSPYRDLDKELGMLRTIQFTGLKVPATVTVAVHK